MPVLVSALAKLGLSLVGRLVTAEALEWCIMWAAKKLVAATDTPHDDEFLAGVEALLNGKKPEAKN